MLVLPGSVERSDYCNYLLGKKDSKHKARPVTPTVITTTPGFELLLRATPYKVRATEFVISWREDLKDIENEKVYATLESFFYLLDSGLASERRAVFVVLHDKLGKGFHLHVVVLNQDLFSGASLDAYNHNRDHVAFARWQDLENLVHDYIPPHASERKFFEPDLTGAAADWDLMVGDALKAAVRAKVDHQRPITIKDRNSVLEILEGAGATSITTDKHAIYIDQGTSHETKLVGQKYTEGFNLHAHLENVAASAEREKLPLAERIVVATKDFRKAFDKRKAELALKWRTTRIESEPLSIAERVAHAKLNRHGPYNHLARTPVRVFHGVTVHGLDRLVAALPQLRNPLGNTQPGKVDGLSLQYAGYPRSAERGTNSERGTGSETELESLVAQRSPKVHPPEKSLGIQENSPKDLLAARHSEEWPDHHFEKLRKKKKQKIIQDALKQLDLLRTGRLLVERIGRLLSAVKAAVFRQRNSRKQMEGGARNLNHHTQEYLRACSDMFIRTRDFKEGAEAAHAGIRKLIRKHAVSLAGPDSLAPTSGVYSVPKHAGGKVFGGAASIHGNGISLKPKNRDPRDGELPPEERDQRNCGPQIG